LGPGKQAQGRVVKPRRRTPSSTRWRCSTRPGSARAMLPSDPAGPLAETLGEFRFDALGYVMFAFSRLELAKWLALCVNRHWFTLGGRTTSNRNGWPTSNRKRWPTSAGIRMHEFGHTLGLGHVGGSGNGERDHVGRAARHHGPGQPALRKSGPALDRAIAQPSDTRSRRTGSELHGAGNRAPVDQLLGLRLGSRMAEAASDRCQLQSVSLWAMRITWPRPIVRPRLARA
jgi:hypothetical protein